MKVDKYGQPKQIILRKERRYYFNFNCEKCKKKNKGYLTSDSKAGLLLDGYGYECDMCGYEQPVNLEQRFFKTVLVEIDIEEFLRK